MIILIVFFTFFIFSAIYGAIALDNYDGVKVLAFLAVLLTVIILFSRKDTSRELMEALPADHKVIGLLYTAVDIGNFRIIYSVFSRGFFTFKSSLSMDLNIPFPQDKAKAESLREDLQELADSLSSEGVLESANPIISGSWESPDEEGKAVLIGQPLYFEFRLKGMTSQWLNQLQDRVMAIIDRHGLQEESFCTISGQDDGTEYRCVKGNLVSNWVFSDSFGKKTRSAHKDIVHMGFTKYDSLFDKKQFFELYDSLVPNSYECNLDNLESVLKTMFGSTKRIIVKIQYEKDGMSINITIPSQKAASTYYIVSSTGYWWVFASGRLDNFRPISSEDEGCACNILLNCISKYALAR